MVGTKTSVVICARLNSRRLPGKALRDINGKPVLHHLIDRLLAAGFRVIVAASEEERAEWLDGLKKYDKTDRFDLFFGDAEDPLKRMHRAAKAHELDSVIRITQDKIFVNPDDIFKLYDAFMRRSLDYIYSSHFTAGTGFEIISMRALDEAANSYKKVEHISYAIKAVTKNIMDYDGIEKKPYRLLIDYPEDLQLMDALFGCLGNDCTNEDVFKFLSENQWASRMNALPLLTIYTCGYNAEKWLQAAMDSVVSQHSFKHFEYILVDDHSTDKTPYLMAKLASEHSNVKYIRNGKNIGLASSSNVALTNARGQYIVRLDADDYFTKNDVLIEMLQEIEGRKLDALYPNNFFGDWSTIQKGSECHHIGGTVFLTRALNHIKFTEKLRGHDSADVFSRAKHCLNIGYWNKPTFFYRQHDESLTKNNLEERAQILRSIEARDASGPQV